MLLIYQLKSRLSLVENIKHNIFKIINNVLVNDFHENIK